MHRHDGDHDKRQDYCRSVFGCKKATPRLITDALVHTVAWLVTSSSARPKAWRVPQPV
jgi:hypothetical protein